MSVNLKRPLLSRRSFTATLPGLALGASWSNRAAAQSKGDSLPDAVDALTLTAPVAPPPLRFTDVKGRDLSLAAFKGHLLVVNLWATWCGPCVEELPTFMGLAPKLKPFGGLVLPISIDTNGIEAVKPFYASNGIRNLPILLDPQGHDLDLLDTDGIPVTLIITPGGKQVARVDGGADWDTPRTLALLRTVAAPAPAGTADFTQV